MPPILRNRRFAEEIIETCNAANACVHIEKVFFRLKTYSLLNKISVYLLSLVDDIIMICCVLTNLQCLIIN